MEFVHRLTDRRRTAIDASPISGSSSLSLDPVQARLREQITLEALLYSLIFAVAALTRFWDLGSRALHHDETLHSYYSWLFATGHGYQHHPLLHGPFLFHANALVYLLFGASDYVSRIMPATAGLILVMVPYLLRGRHHLGRWGALAASLFLLYSPSILYYSRFLRHDIYTLLGAMLLFVAIARYIERPERRWPIIGGVATALMITNHEISYAVLGILVSFLALAIVLRVAPRVLIVAVGAIAAFVVAATGLRLLGVPGLPPIPWQNPSTSTVTRFLHITILHPIVVSGLLICLFAAAIIYRMLSQRRDPDLGWVDGLLGGAPEGSTTAALRSLLQRGSGLAAGIGLCVLIFVVLYTSLFTNLPGLLSGTIGAAGYWLGQQGVQRGDQPWFYYLVLLPQYEFVAVALFPVATAWVAWRGFRTWRLGSGPDRRFRFRGLLIYWSLLMLLILSWAGEKMPWLAIHVTLPMVLLAAAMVGAIAEQIERRQGLAGRWRWASGALGLGIIATLSAAFLLFAWATNGPYTDVAGEMQHTVRPEVADRWWIVYLPFVALAVMLALGVIRLGLRQTAQVLLAAGTIALVLAQVHVAWRLTYQEGDVAKDMLIYNQTTPYVPLVSREVTRLSQELTGGMGLTVWYDNNTQWPFNWYLRNFPNRYAFGTELPDSPDAPVILITKDNLSTHNVQRLTGYTYEEYPMRWAYPEVETYRRFAIAPELNNTYYQNLGSGQLPPYSLADVARSIWTSIAGMREPQEQGKIFRLVAFRELPTTVWPYDFRVYVRNDLAAHFDGIRY